MASDGARKQFWKRSNSKVPGRWVCRGAGSGSGVRGQEARRLPGLRRGDLASEETAPGWRDLGVGA